MKFEKDVFISYAHLDNKPLDETEVGWITAFHKLLQTRLEQIIGSELNVWRDERLTGNEIFGPEILDQFPKMKIMVSIITPRYVGSDWCTREMDAFYKAADLNGGISVGNKSRIFKVVKTPVDKDVIEGLPDDIHRIFDEILDYKFYIVEQTGKFKELTRSRFVDNSIQQAFMDKLNDVVQDIAALIKRLNKSETEEIVQRKVYLAETTYDLQRYRDSLVRELQEAGFTVLPSKNLPFEINKFNSEVKKYVDESMLSIHLVSNTNYAVQPEGSDKSTVMIQNEVAAEKSALTNNFNRLIWIPPVTPEASINQKMIELQEVYVSALKQNTELQAGADILVGPLEECKQAIFDTIHRIDAEEKAKADAEKEALEKAKKAATAVTTIATTQSEPKLVYLVCDQRDLDNTRPLEDAICESGNEILLPFFDGDLAQLRQAHLDNLKVCDAVIIYYGAGNYRWAGSMKSDLLRLPALGRTTPLLDKIIYLAGPADNDKETFKANDFSIVNGISGFAPELLKSFIEKLSQLPA
jgi:predicted nucleic acid-binding protein